MQDDKIQKITQKHKQKYEEKKKKLQKSTISPKNKKLYLKFLDKLEYKLQRTNNLRRLDLGCYRTLLGYIIKIENVNNWFKNKPLESLTKQDIKKVYDDLEDGKILNHNGKPFKDTKSYYNKIFKSILFEMANKKELAKEVMEYYNNNETNDEVRFITEEDVRKIISTLNYPEHILLFWLAWDYGENMPSLVKLKKQDFERRINHLTKEPEYVLRYRKEILKRARRERSDINNYPETVMFLDQILSKIEPNDYLFKFNEAMPRKLLRRALKITGIKAKPQMKQASFKDFRSGMACDLLGKGWSFEDVNKRLGHAPSSNVLDKYVNYKAINSNQPKKQFQEFEIKKLQQKMEAQEETNKILSRRLEKAEKLLKIISKTLKK